VFLGGPEKLGPPREPSKNLTVPDQLASQTRRIRDNAARVTFDEACTFEAIGDGRYRGVLGEDWYQGRGVFGGLISAIVLRSIERTVDDPARSARTLALFLAAPAIAGECVVRTAIERAGKYVTQASARVECGGELVASAIATYARPRESALVHRSVPMPAFPPPHRVPAGPDGLLIPKFCQHFEFRQAIGDAPFSGATHAHLGGWCRLREPVRPDAAMIAALLDSWAPAVLSLSPEWSPAATIDLTIQFTTTLPLADTRSEAYYAFEARSTVVEDGYADDQATLWTADGLPVATARQLVAVFR
jgi:acyl-CoA thioesterase